MSEGGVSGLGVWGKKGEDGDLRVELGLWSEMGVRKRGYGECVW